MSSPVGLNEKQVEWIRSQIRKPKEIAGRKILIFGAPKIGKTTLAARLGRHNLFITDEDGYTALVNNGLPDDVGHWYPMPFFDWGTTQQVMQALEAGQLPCEECGEPYDNLILDTVSGMIMHMLQKLIKSGITPQSGKLSPESPGLPDYFVSRERMIPVMSQMALMQKVSVTMLMHTREEGKVSPKLQPDAHNSAYQVINKYTSLQAYLFVNQDGDRTLQVNPTGNNVVVGSRYNFPSDFVTDDEFVAHIQKWKGVI